MNFRNFGKSRTNADALFVAQTALDVELFVIFGGDNSATFSHFRKIFNFVANFRVEVVVRRIFGHIINLLFQFNTLIL